MNNAVINKTFPA
jgi:hypothetical protein